VVTFTGNGVASTVGHGLGVAPSMIITKGRSLATNWCVYHKSLTNPQNVGLILNSTVTPQTNSTFWNNTAPTSAVYSVGTQGTTNANLGGQVAYCWSEIAGFSKFDSYTGNGTADGPFVYTGFRPKFVMIKNASAVENWYILDSVRNTYNAVNNWIVPNTTNAENEANLGGSPVVFFDFLSNGFKIRNTGSFVNTNAATYIYAAFAENPFKNANAR
jgi:hypothetical protein